MSMQPSVIHAPSTSINQGNGQSAQDVNPTDEILSEDEARKRREQLNRRPSYRLILKDLETVDKQLKKDPDDVEDGNAIGHQSARPMADTQPAHSIANDSSISYPTVMAPHLTVPNGDLSGLQLGIQTSGIAVTIGQYSPQVISNRVQELPQNSVLGLNLPVNSDILGLKPMPMDSGLTTSGAQFVTNNHGWNVNADSSEWSSNLMAGYNSSPSPLGMAGGSRGELNDDGTRKRQVRLLKNREAAKECRRKKKEYVKCLENRVAVLENQNKALIEELKTLKELYCRKEKGD